MDYNKDHPLNTNSTQPRTLIFHRLVISSLLATLLAAGCSSSSVKPESAMNPPPKAKFSDFNRFELAPIAVADAKIGNKPELLAEFSKYLKNRLEPRLEKWNSKPLNGPERVLVIAPKVTQLKFVGTAARLIMPFSVFAGPSSVTLKTAFVEKSGGAAIAEPEHFANSVGKTDEAEMFDRIANSLEVYLLLNYPNAVGGTIRPNGMDASKMTDE